MALSGLEAKRTQERWDTQLAHVKQLLADEKEKTRKNELALALETTNYKAKRMETEDLAKRLGELQESICSDCAWVLFFYLIHFIVRDVDSVISVSLHALHDKS